jgi:hypothetical protein
MRRPPGLTGSRGCQCRSEDVLTDTLNIAAARGGSTDTKINTCMNAIGRTGGCGRKRVAKGCKCCSKFKHHIPWIYPDCMERLQKFLRRNAAIGHSHVMLRSDGWRHSVIWRKRVWSVLQRKRRLKIRRYSSPTSLRMALTLGAVEQARAFRALAMDGVD